ncbi:hypothetical protein UFOVP581_29 [uncultured Caudovirales phage]|uniref:Uncharacterized protein n=1 Tax=uncultured Caudovirales phage TaxID=2100421 RepID=A0A6J5PBZ9_9CAUD|nr:hypothetical protein UFOVP581_29 [uncultured Caudovirales phage]
MATLAELERALINADKAGDMDAARKIAVIVKRERENRDNSIPEQTQIQGTVIQTPEPSFADKAIGVGETALTGVTGVAGGTLGMIGGTLKGLAEQLIAGNYGTPEGANAVAESAMRSAGIMTYAPRGQVGQGYVQNVGETLGVVPAVMGVGALGASAITQSARSAAPIIQAAGRQVAAPVARAASQVASQVRERINPTPQPTPGTRGSGGSAGTDIADIRRTNAQGLPVPIDLTEGQATRGFAEQRFERETAKLPEQGASLRERFAEQNQQLQQNLDSFIEMTRADAPDLRSIGLSVDDALTSRVNRDKTKIRALYKEAEKAGEMEVPVTLDSVVKHLVDNAPESHVASVLKAVRDKAIQLGVAVDTPDGLIAKPVTLNTAELFRRSINNSVNHEAPNVRQASIMKGLIDNQTAELGGGLYKRARTARTKFANDYGNVGLVKNLIGTKNGSTDRAIALEDVLRRTVIDPSTSLDTLRHTRKLLQTEGQKGMQAWRELQGGTLKHIRDEALKNVARDDRGSAIISPSMLDKTISQLDRSGKLELIFGTQGADKLRILNDVAKVVLTSPPGSVNTSNTASVLAGMMDLAISGSAGVPVPLMTGFKMITSKIKDRKLRARVQKALGNRRTRGQNQ